MTAARTRRGPGTRRVRLAALVLSALGSLLVAELAVRVLHLAPAVKPIVVDEDASVYKRSANPILGFELKADYRDDHADLEKSYPRTNAHGQRDIERSIDKAAGRRRILLLGDSVVEGLGIRDLDDTISGQWERLDDAGQIEVLNFGVSAYCTRAEVELLEVKGLRFNPDIIVLVFTENDYDNFNREAFKLQGETRAPRVIKQLFLHSDLVRTVCLRTNLFGFAAQTDPVAWNRRAIGDNNVVEGLKRLRELADRHGFDVLIAVWPKFFDDRIEDVRAMPGDPDQLVIERLARMVGLASVRLSVYFRAHRASIEPSPNPRLRYTNGDSMHPSIEGARIAAVALKRTLDQWNGSDRERPAVTLDRDAIAAAAAMGTGRPNYAVFYTTTGKMLMDSGRIEDAVRSFEMAIEAYPDLANAHLGLGLARMAQGRTVDAIEHYQRALVARPYYAQAHNNLGSAWRASGDSARAIDHFRQALALRPDLVLTHFNLANTLATEDRYEEAIVHFRHVVRLAPDMAGAHGNLGHALLRIERIEESIRHFHEALRLGPESAKAHYGLALALERLGTTGRAIEHYRHTLQLQSDHTQAWQGLNRLTQDP